MKKKNWYYTSSGEVYLQCVCVNVCILFRMFFCEVLDAGTQTISRIAYMPCNHQPIYGERIDRKMQNTAFCGYCIQCIVTHMHEHGKATTTTQTLVHPICLT